MIEKDSLRFLSDLKENNNRDWFLSQKKRYESYKKNYLEVISRLLAAMVPYDPGLAQLEPKDCTFRINRDIRFSKDKSPYKTHMGIWMSPGPKHSLSGGYYVHIEPGKSFIGGGIWHPENEALKKIRKEIEFFHEDLDAVLEDKAFRARYGSLDRGDALKTAPKGFDKEHPAIEHLKLKSFTASCTIDDATVTSSGFEDTIASQLALIKPLNDFLNRALDNPEA